MQSLLRARLLSGPFAPRACTVLPCSGSGRSSLGALYAQHMRNKITTSRYRVPFSRLEGDNYQLNRYDPPVNHDEVIPFPELMKVLEEQMSNVGLKFEDNDLMEDLELVEMDEATYQEFLEQSKPQNEEERKIMADKSLPFYERFQAWERVEESEVDDISKAFNDPNATPTNTLHEAESVEDLREKLLGADVKEMNKLITAEMANHPHNFKNRFYHDLYQSQIYLPEPYLEEADLNEIHPLEDTDELRGEYEEDYSPGHHILSELMAFTDTESLDDVGANLKKNLPHLKPTYPFASCYAAVDAYLEFALSPSSMAYGWRTEHSEEPNIHHWADRYSFPDREVGLYLKSGNAFIGRSVKINFEYRTMVLLQMTVGSEDEGTLQNVLRIPPDWLLAFKKQKWPHYDRYAPLFRESEGYTQTDVHFFRADKSFRAQAIPQPFRPDHPSIRSTFPVFEAGNDLEDE